MEPASLLLLTPLTAALLSALGRTPPPFSRRLLRLTTHGVLLAALHTGVRALWESIVYVSAVHIDGPFLEGTTLSANGAAVATALVLCAAISAARALLASP